MRALIVLVVVSGCAPGFMSVSTQDWQTVPAAQRTAIDGAYQAQLAQTTAELAAAKTQVVAMPRVSPAHKPIAVAPGDDWANAMRAYDHSEQDARTRIDTAALDVARLASRLRIERVALLTAKLAELRTVHELDRARAVDHNLLGDDTYDTAGYRGQLARAQTPRFAAEARTAAAQAALHRATAGLAAAKETYAALVRTGPLAPTSSDSALRLTAWTSTEHDDRWRRWHGRAAPMRYLQAPRIAVR
jgi:hypothetical protein